MNLTSCEECGVALDKENLHFPDTHDHDSQELIMENVEYDNHKDEYVAVVPCPVCGNKIRE